MYVLYVYIMYMYAHTHTHTHTHIKTHEYIHTYTQIHIPLSFSLIYWLIGTNRVQYKHLSPLSALIKSCQEFVNSRCVQVSKCSSSWRTFIDFS